MTRFSFGRHACRPWRAAVLVALCMLFFVNTAARADAPATAPASAPAAAVAPTPDPTGAYQSTPTAASTPGYAAVTEASTPKEMAAAINATANAQARNYFS